MTGMILWLLRLIALSAPSDAPYYARQDIAQAVIDATGGDPEPIAELVALGAKEGHFNPEAVSTDWAGHAFGVWQLHESNFGWLHITQEEACDPYTSAPVALRLVRKSFEVCARRPWEERLGWYAAGGPTCNVEEGLEDSRIRLALALRLLQRMPPPTVFYDYREHLTKRSTQINMWDR